MNGNQAGNDQEIFDRLERVRERIARAEETSGRAAGAVRLIAVTKTVEVERVRGVIAAGVNDLGENYIQEAREKMPLVISLPAAAPKWHFIGHLQSNKAKLAVTLFSLIHSVGSLPLAQEIGKQATKLGKIQPILIEVNLAGSEVRSGVPPDSMLDLAERVAEVQGVEIKGLMGMAPFGPDREAARPYFKRLSTLWTALPAENRHELSMGMSGDFEVAIEEGATMVRIGTALFGPRKA